MVWISSSSGYVVGVHLNSSSSYRGDNGTYRVDSFIIIYLLCIKNGVCFIRVSILCCNIIHYRSMKNILKNTNFHEY